MGWIRHLPWFKTGNQIASPFISKCHPFKEQKDTSIYGALPPSSSRRVCEQFVLEKGFIKNRGIYIKNHGPQNPTREFTRQQSVSC